MRGKLITFEGSEGCGKSTQSRLLYEYLKNKGRRVTYLREPGGTKISEKIRNILLDCENDNMSEAAEMLLYMAARAQIVHEVIRPALLKGRIVLCDRFSDSTVAYQGFGLGIDVDLIKSIGNFSTCGVKPDLTIFLDLPVERGLKHRERGKDRIEKRPLSYHSRVRRGYLKLAASEPKRIKIVRVAKDKALTQQRIRKLVEEYVI